MQNSPNPHSAPDGLAPVGTGFKLKAMLLVPGPCSIKLSGTLVNV